MEFKVRDLRKSREKQRAAERDRQTDTKRLRKRRRETKIGRASFFFGVGGGESASEFSQDRPIIHRMMTCTSLTARNFLSSTAEIFWQNSGKNPTVETS